MLRSIQTWWEANQGLAGIFTQENHAHEAILELLESCRERTGWPIKSLGVELQQLWGSTEPAKAVAAARVSV